MGSSSSSSDNPLTTSCSTYTIKTYLIQYYKKNYPYTCGNKTNDEIWNDKILNEKVSVSIRGVSFSLGFKHHYIACEGICDKWLIFERTIDDYGTKYACDTVRGNHCRTLGKEKLKDVINAYNNTSVYT